MTDIQQRIASILRLHMPVDDGEGFFCSCSSTAVLLAKGIATDYVPAHIAEVLVSELGLTPEWKASPDAGSPPSEVFHDNAKWVAWVQSQPGAQCRYVTGWIDE